MKKNRGQILIGLFLGLALVLVGVKEARAACCVKAPVFPSTVYGCRDIDDSDYSALCNQDEERRFSSCAAVSVCPQYNPNQGNTNANTNTSAGAAAGSGSRGGGGTTVNSRLNKVLESSPSYSLDVDEDTMTEYLGLIISVFLGLLGTMFVGLILYAGYNWMTAAGKEEKVEKAQHTIRAAVYGLILTVGVYAIWQFVFARIVQL